MNDEIKEILDYLKIKNGTIGSELSYKETHLLLDYITNLQQKVEYYEGFEINKTIDKIRLQNNREYKEVMTQLEDYKSRCEKAVEITQNLLNTENSGYYKIIFQKQLDILNGRSDE